MLKRTIVGDSLIVETSTGVTVMPADGNIVKLEKGSMYLVQVCFEPDAWYCVQCDDLYDKEELYRYFSTLIYLQPEGEEK